MADEAIGKILDIWYLANQWQLMDETDQQLATAAFYQVLRANAVPCEAYMACYDAALTTRARRKSLGEKVLNLSAEDLAVEWPAIRDSFERANASGQKLLVENNAGSCQRCHGTGQEEMVDGSVRPGCTHEPLSEEEISERATAKAEQIRFMRAAVKKVGAPKPVVVEAPQEVEALEMRLRCTFCGRRVSRRGGWVAGELCGALLDKTAFCAGLMEVIGRETELAIVLTDVRSAVYQATASFQGLQLDDLISGDAFEMRRQVADFAVKLVREAWKSNSNVGAKEGK